jgi:hypothetical protein
MKYDNYGMRLTDCCAAHSTYHDTTLCCKACGRKVEFGEGDGSEHVEDWTPLSRTSRTIKKD